MELKTQKDAHNIIIPPFVYVAITQGDSRFHSYPKPLTEMDSLGKQNSKNSPILYFFSITTTPKYINASSYVFNYPKTLLFTENAKKYYLTPNSNSSKMENVTLQFN